jgi:hypothetical protein
MSRFKFSSWTAIDISFLVISGQYSKSAYLGIRSLLALAWHQLRFEELHELVPFQWVPFQWVALMLERQVAGPIFVSSIHAHMSMIAYLRCGTCICSILGLRFHRDIIYSISSCSKANIFVGKAFFFRLS